MTYLKEVVELLFFEEQNFIIKKIEFKLKNENTKYTINSLNDDNLKDLYAYFNSFTEEEKEYFGFPLFRPVNKSYLDFKNSFNLWKSEGSAWNVFLLYKEECAEVLAVAI